MPDNSELNISYIYGGLYHPDSGVSNYIETVGNYFTEHGHRVSFLVGEAPSQSDDRVRSLGTVAMRQVNGSESGIVMPVSRGVVRQALAELSPDVLDVQMYNPFFDGRFIRAVDDEAAVIGRMHALPGSMGVELGTRALRYVSRSALERFDYVSSTSVPTQEFTRRALKIESEVLPNPIDIARFKTGVRMPQYDDGKTNLVFIGRLDERKGVTQLIEAIGALDAAAQQELRVLIAGKGKLRNRLETAVNSYGLNDVVDFLGFIEEEDKPNLLASADIAVFPAVAGESFGIVLVEAMAARAGVVLGGDNPGYRSVLGDVPEAMFNPNDIGAFAAVLSRYIYQPEDREHIHKLQQNAVEQYDISVIGAQLEATYKDALAKRRYTKASS